MSPLVIGIIIVLALIIAVIAFILLTPAPSKPAPSKPAPSTPAPSTPAPSTPAPSKPAPSKPAPSTTQPVQQINTNIETLKNNVAISLSNYLNNKQSYDVFLNTLRNAIQSSNYCGNMNDSLTYECAIQSKFNAILANSNNIRESTNLLSEYVREFSTSKENMLGTNTYPINKMTNIQYSQMINKGIADAILKEATYKPPSYGPNVGSLGHIRHNNLYKIMTSRLNLQP